MYTTYNLKKLSNDAMWRYVHTFRLGTWTRESGPWTLLDPSSPVVHVVRCVHVSTLSLLFAVALCSFPFLVSKTS